MPFYENVFIARQDISATQAEALTEQFAALIAEQGGTVTKKESWGLRNIAYRIKKNRKGHYTLMNIEAPAAAITEMERQMRINEDVLRYLTIRVDALEEGPSAMLQSRSRDDRDGPRRGFGGREGGGFRDREGGGGFGRDRDREGGGYRGRDDRPPRRDFESEGRPAPETPPAPAAEGDKS